MAAKKEKNKNMSGQNKTSPFDFIAARRYFVFLRQTSGDRASAATKTKAACAEKMLDCDCCKAACGGWVFFFIKSCGRILSCKAA